MQTNLILCYAWLYKLYYSSNTTSSLLPTLTFNFLLLHTVQFTHSPLQHALTFRQQHYKQANHHRLFHMPHSQPCYLFPFSGFHFSHTSIHVNIKQPWWQHTPVLHTHHQSYSLVKRPESFKLTSSCTMYLQDIPSALPLNPARCLSQAHESSKQLPLFL